MPSEAFRIFDNYTVTEIETLADIFSERNDKKRGRNTAYGLLHGGLVILVSGWETYCEDVSKEAVKELVGRNNLTFDKIPKTAQREILKYANQENVDKVDLLKEPLAKLPDEGWKGVLYETVEDYLRDFNTPKFNRKKGKNLKELFSHFLSTDVEEAIYKLTGKNSHVKSIDKLIKIRGNIAHRGKLEEKDKFLAKDLKNYLNTFHIACAAIDAIIRQEFGLRYGSPVPWKATNTITKHLPHYDITTLIKHHIAQDKKMG